MSLFPFDGGTGHQLCIKFHFLLMLRFWKSITVWKITLFRTSWQHHIYPASAYFNFNWSDVYTECSQPRVLMFFRMYHPSNGHIRDILCISYCKSFQLFTRIWNKVGWAPALSVCGESCRTVCLQIFQIFRKILQKRSSICWRTHVKSLQTNFIFTLTLFQCLHQLLSGAESHTQFLILSKHELYHKAKHKSRTLHYVPLCLSDTVWNITALSARFNICATSAHCKGVCWP